MLFYLDLEVALGMTRRAQLNGCVAVQGKNLVTG